MFHEKCLLNIDISDVRSNTRLNTFGQMHTYCNDFFINKISCNVVPFYKLDFLETFYGLSIIIPYINAYA